LFDAAVRYADQPHAKLPERLPVRTPPPGQTASYVRERLALEAAEMTLVRVSAGTLVIKDPVEELTAVLRDLYRSILRNRLALKLIDRCAADYPELAAIWFGEGRWAQHELLVQLLKTRSRRRHLRRIEHPDIVARTILETIAFWGMHRHFDPSPQEV